MRLFTLAVVGASIASGLTWKERAAAERAKKEKAEQLAKQKRLEELAAKTTTSWSEPETTTTTSSSDSDTTTSWYRSTTEPKQDRGGKPKREGPNLIGLDGSEDHGSGDSKGKPRGDGGHNREHPEGKTGPTGKNDPFKKPSFDHEDLEGQKLSALFMDSLDGIKRKMFDKMPQNTQKIMFEEFVEDLKDRKVPEETLMKKKFLDSMDQERWDRFIVLSEVEQEKSFEYFVSRYKKQGDDDGDDSSPLTHLITDEGKTRENPEADSGPPGKRDPFKKPYFDHKDVEDQKLNALFMDSLDELTRKVFGNLDEYKQKNMFEEFVEDLKDKKVPEEIMIKQRFLNNMSQDRWKRFKQLSEDEQEKSFYDFMSLYKIHSQRQEGTHGDHDDTSEDKHLRNKFFESMDRETRYKYENSDTSEKKMMFNQFLKKHENREQDEHFSDEKALKKMFYESMDGRMREQYEKLDESEKKAWFKKFLAKHNDRPDHSHGDEQENQDPDHDKLKKLFLESMNERVKYEFNKLSPDEKRARFEDFVKKQKHHHGSSGDGRPDNLKDKYVPDMEEMKKMFYGSLSDEMKHRFRTADENEKKMMFEDFLRKQKDKHESGTSDGGKDKRPYPPSRPTPGPYEPTTPTVDWMNGDEWEDPMFEPHKEPYYPEEDETNPHWPTPHEPDDRRIYMAQHQVNNLKKKAKQLEMELMLEVYDLAVEMAIANLDTAMAFVEPFVNHANQFLQRNRQ